MSTTPFALARTKPVDENGNLTRAWVLYFNSVATVDDIPDDDAVAIDEQDVTY